MYHIIVNRTAASGQCEAIWNSLLPVIRDSGKEYQVHVTERPCDTESLIRSLTDGSKEVHLILLGGDGTLNLVAQNIVQMEKTRVSVIPVGSGNDFARDMNISSNPEKALRHLLSDPEEILLDYGTLTYQPEAASESTFHTRRFLISCGVGFDAETCHQVNSGKIKKLMNRLHLGKISYLLTAVSLLIGGRSTETSLSLDGEEAQTFPLFLSVSMLHRYEGGGVAFAPSADPTDGLFDVCAVKDLRLPTRIAALLLLLLQKHEGLDSLIIRRCRTVTASFREPVWLHTDGEVPGKIRSFSMVCQKGFRLVK